MHPKRLEAFDEAVRGAVDGVDGSMIDTDIGEVFVRARKGNFDNVCQVAYDFGLVPCGVIKAGGIDHDDCLAARFKRRNDDETLEMA